MNNKNINVTVALDIEGCIIAKATHRDGMTCVYDGDNYVMTNTDDGDVETSDALQYAARTAHDARDVVAAIWRYRGADRAVV